LKWWVSYVKYRLQNTIGKVPNIKVMIRVFNCNQNFGFKL